MSSSGRRSWSHAIEQDDLVAPVELIGFTLRKAPRDVSRSRRLPTLHAPSRGIPPHGVIAASTQLFEVPDQPQPQRLASSLGPVACQQSVKFYRPPSSFGRGWTTRSYSNEVAPDLSTFRTVFRDTFRSRAIYLIVLPLMKCSRRIRAIVSTISIPDHLLRYKAGSATDQYVRDQF